MKQLAITLAVLLLGASPYKPFLGTWECSRPSAQSGYHSTLHVTQTSDGSLQFISLGDASSPDRGLLFDLKLASDGTYSLHNPDYPYAMTGTLSAGSIVFSPPPPSPKRFAITFSNGGQTMSYVGYSKNDFGIFRSDYTTVCTR